MCGHCPLLQNDQQLTPNNICYNNIVALEEGRKLVQYTEYVYLTCHCGCLFSGRLLGLDCEGQRTYNLNKTASKVEWQKRRLYFTQALVKKRNISLFCVQLYVAAHRALLSDFCCEAGTPYRWMTPLTILMPLYHTFLSCAFGLHIKWLFLESMQ